MAISARTARRAPTQGRSRATREAIFTAATQILERSGEAAFNTNRIAERAGVSVGTIYQYFPNKEAILVAMARAEMDGVAAYHDGQTEKGGRSGDAVRHSIRRLIKAFEGRPATRRAAVKAVIAAESAQAFGGEIDRNARRLPRLGGASRCDEFVLTRAVVGAVRAAVLEEYAGLHSPAFEEALVSLVTGYRRNRN
jgi:AcrR family transcriptional regulator